jgi:hypothetical protein
VAACSIDRKVVQTLIAAQGGPFLRRQEATAAIAKAIRLCVASSAPPCTGDCVARGNPCEVVVDEWDPSIGPFYAAPEGGSGWYFRVPVGLPIAYRHLPSSINVPALTAPAVRLSNVPR